MHSIFSSSAFKKSVRKITAYKLQIVINTICNTPDLRRMLDPMGSSSDEDCDSPSCTYNVQSQIGESLQIYTFKNEK